jgi:hypothetical protein
MVVYMRYRERREGGSIASCIRSMEPERRQGRRAGASVSVGLNGPHSYFWWALFFDDVYAGLFR